jgi:hypothetical protein
LGITDKEFNQVSGVPAEARQATDQKTATQAVIQNSSAQVQNAFERSTVADFLGAVIEEIILCAIDSMNINKWIAINVDPDSAYAENDAADVAKTYEEISARKLADAAQGIKWSILVDVESLSPVTEDQQAAKLNQAMAVMGNPAQARLLSNSPELSKRLLDVNGIKSGRDQGLIQQALVKTVQQEMELARLQAAPLQGGGVSSLPGVPIAVSPNGPAAAPIGSGSIGPGSAA